MPPDWTAEQFAQRALDVGIVSESQLREVWSELGTRNVEVETIKQVMMGRGLVTNYQIDRLLQGFKTGYFYGEYKVLYLVGAGTFARVYRATHRKTNELFALKVLRKSMSDDLKNTDQFRREGELGATLKHPNIVAIHEVYSKGKTHYIVMDFVEGHNLRDFFKIRGRFEPVEATRITTDIAAGLNFAFQQGVTHRDLKMSNVLLSSSGEAKLVDFGLAAVGGAEGDDLNPRTIDYAGLERATNVRKDDTRSDIFFLGCIYYQLMSGVPALAETRERAQRLMKSRYQEVRPITEIRPELPLHFVRVVNKALEFDPARRYQTPGEMLTDLKLATKRVAERAENPDAKPTDKALEGLGDDGEPKRLMVVEADTKMQDLLRELFKKNGYRVLVTADPERLFQRFDENPQMADVLLISSGKIGAEALEAFQRLPSGPSTREVPAVLLLGDEQGGWADQIEACSHRTVLAMPVKGSALRQAVLGVMSCSGTKKGEGTLA